MTSSYYEILDVAPMASAAEIKKAYRQAALKNHPDRGGEHAKMVLINEAYLVLSNPVLRAEYDQFLAADATEESAWQAQTAPVQKAAQQYPKTWADFEHWSERLAADFTQARYGKHEVWNNWSIPKIENSHSGLWFCLLGSVMWILFLGFYWKLYPWLWQEVIHNRRGNRGYVLLAALPPFLGAWAGSYFHQSMGPTIAAMLKDISAATKKQKGRNRTAFPPHQTDPQLLTCPQCGQKLRLPTNQGTLSVTCP